MQLSQIQFIETSDAEYQILFLYKGHSLQSGNLLRSMTAEQIVPLLKKICSDFDTVRADTNFDALKAQYEGQTITI